MSFDSRRKLARVARDLCKELRKESTKAERILWDNLRNRRLSGRKFYRQHPFFLEINDRETFRIVDFYCHECRLVVEVDGEIHQQTRQADLERMRALNEVGLSVIRFRNSEVENSLFDVLDRIRKCLQQTHPSLPKRRDGDEFR